ncbi:glycosyltransferase family 39 protein, partial [candidate division KSB1 bacterium]
IFLKAVNKLKFRTSWMQKDLFLILILVFASFLFRFIYYVEINDTPYFLPTGEGLDQNTYIEWAKEIRSGELIGEGVFDFAPLYPYVLAGAFLISNNDLNFALLVQLIICSLGSVIIYVICKKIFGKWPAFISGLIYSFYGVLVFFTLQFLGESISILLLLISLYYYISGQEKSKGIYFLTSGIILGVAALGRPNFLLIPVLVFLWWIYNEIRKNSNNRKFYLIYLLGAFLAIAPATLRNYVIAKDFVPITSHGGINFYLGNNTDATGTLTMPEEIPPTQKGAVEYSKIIAEREEGRTLKPSEVSFYWIKKGMNYIISDPFKFFKLEMKKILLFFEGYEIPLDSNFEIYKDRFKTLRFSIGYWLIAPLALFGIFVSRRKTTKDTIILLYFTGVFLSVILFYVSSRYRLPAVPLLMIYAGYSFKYIFSEIKNTGRKEKIIKVFILLFLFLIVNINVKQNSKKDMYTSISKYNLGNSFVTQGYLDGGIELYEEALSLNEQWHPAKVSLAAAYNLKAANALNNEQSDLAVELLNKSINLDNTKHEYYFNIGNAYIKLKDYTSAVASFERSVSLSPEYTNGLTNLGYAYFRWGVENINIEYIDKAINYLSRTLKIDANQSRAREILNVGIYIKQTFDKDPSQARKIMVDLRKEFNLN